MQSPTIIDKQEANLPPPSTDGLSDEEVLQRRARFGSNSLPPEKRSFVWPDVRHLQNFYQTGGHLGFQFFQEF